jgi:hypothetical protein
VTTQLQLIIIIIIIIIIMVFTSSFKPRKTANIQHKKVLFCSMGMPFGIWQHREWEFPDNVSNIAVVVLKKNQISSSRRCLVFLEVGDSQNGEGEKVMITNMQPSLWSLRDVTKRFFWKTEGHDKR